MHGHPDLAEIAALIAKQYGIGAAHDTHYDAQNWELYWWDGNTRQAIDLQPYPDGSLEIRHIRAHFPWPGRFYAWARNVVPMFPCLGRSESTILGQLAVPYTSSQVVALVQQVLRPN